MGEDTVRYRAWELSKVLGDDDLEIKITGDPDEHGLDGTRWLSITRAELAAITAILTAGK